MSEGVEASVTVCLNYIFCIPFRILGLSCLLVDLAATSELSVRCTKELLWYSAATLVWLVIQLVSHIIVAIHSGRGGVFDTKAREKVPTLVHIRAGNAVLYSTITLITARLSGRY